MNNTKENQIEIKVFNYSQLYTPLTEDELLSANIHRKINSTTKRDINFFCQNSVIHVSFYQDNKFDTDIYIDLNHNPEENEYSHLSLFMKNINNWLIGKSNLNWSVLYHDEKESCKNKYLGREFSTATVN